MSYRIDDHARGQSADTRQASDSFRSAHFSIDARIERRRIRLRKTWLKRLGLA